MKIKKKKKNRKIEKINLQKDVIEISCEWKALQKTMDNTSKQNVKIRIIIYDKKN